MNLILAIDFGSTYTKIAAFDLNENKLIAQAQDKTTTDIGISIGLENAKEKLFRKISKQNFKIVRSLACSSAAGGLRMIAVGLTPQLTTKAAQEAVLGAGAKLVGAYSFKLSDLDIASILKASPDLLLLSGGTDGGDEKNILHNSEVLAASKVEIPIIAAGNRCAASKIKNIFEKKDKFVTFVDNIFPSLDTLNIEPAKHAIRDIFLTHITRAKGLEIAEKSICDIIMPTPLAVLRGSTLVSRGTARQTGWGDLLVLDIGGATTDIHSVAVGYPTNPEIIFKGLPEPLARRTVEGDLGIRYNASTILESFGIEKIKEKYKNYNSHTKSDSAILEYIKKISDNVGWLPQSIEEVAIDLALGELAIENAMSRHVGTISTSYINGYKIKVQRGKDLTEVRHIIGTGGILVSEKLSEKIFEAALFKKTLPEELRPQYSLFYRDINYIFYAIGLIGTHYPESAFELAQKYINKIDYPIKNKHIKPTSH